MKIIESGEVSDSVTIIENNYIAKASPGLKAYIERFNVTAATIASSIDSRPSLYADIDKLIYTRGKGIGKIILSYLAYLANDRNCGHLEWWGLDWNEPAVKFYRRSLDALPMDEWTVQRLEQLAGQFQHT